MVRQQAPELRTDDHGRWRVTTMSGSVYDFDLDQATVERLPGPNAAITINDLQRRLREIDVCRVGEVGRWTMESQNPHLDFYWSVTTKIVSIEPVTDTGDGLADG